MGMFDHVRTDVPLPDGWEQVDLQTKDFECLLTTVWITADGRLMIEDFDYESVPKDERPYPDDEGICGLFGSMRKINCKWRDLDFHGWFSFYGSEGKHPNCVWHEYRAKFTDGQLVEIVAQSSD